MFLCLSSWCMLGHSFWIISSHKMHNGHTTRSVLQSFRHAATLLGCTCRSKSSSPARRGAGGEGRQGAEGEGREHADWLVTLGEQLGGLQAQMQATASTSSLHALQKQSERTTPLIAALHLGVWACYLGKALVSMLLICRHGWYHEGHKNDCRLHQSMFRRVL